MYKNNASTQGCVPAYGITDQSHAHYYRELNLDTIRYILKQSAVAY